MSCEDREMALALHVEGELDTREAEALKGHLRSCAGCRELFESLQDSQAALREHTLLATDLPSVSSLRGAVLASLQAPPKETSARPALALAASLLLALGAFTLLQFTEPPPPHLQGPPPQELSTLPVSPPPSSISNPSERVVQGEVSPPPTSPPPSSQNLREPGIPNLPAVSTAHTNTASTKPAATKPTATKPAATKTSEFPDSPRTVSPATAVDETLPTVVKLISDSPDLVIYWLIEPSTNEKDAPNDISPLDISTL